MSRDSQAQVFIRTLVVLLENHRVRRTLHLRHQVKANAERFMQTFRTDPDGDLHPSADALHQRRSDQGAGASSQRH